MQDILADALSRDLHETELGHREHGHLRPITAELFLQLIKYFPLVPFIIEVDEVDHDDSPDIAEPELPADLPGGLHVGAEGVLFLLLLRRVAAAVHIDDDHRLGRIDDEVAAALQPDLACKGGLDLLFDFVHIEDRPFVAMELDFVEQLHRGIADVGADLLMEFAGIDNDAGDVIGEQVANDTRRRRHVLVEKARGFLRLDGLFDFPPRVNEILQVVRQRRIVLPLRNSADDDAEALGEDGLNDLAEPALFLEAADLLGDADLAVKGEENEEASGEGDLGSHADPLLPHGFLRDLDDDLLPLFELYFSVGGSMLGMMIAAVVGRGWR